MILYYVLCGENYCVIRLREKTIPTKFNEKKATCKMENFYILLAFL